MMFERMLYTAGSDRLSVWLWCVEHSPPRAAA